MPMKMSMHVTADRSFAAALLEPSCIAAHPASFEAALEGTRTMVNVRGFRAIVAARTSVTASSFEALILAFAKTAFILDAVVAAMRVRVPVAPSAMTDGD
jgi:hypothetical protein